MATVQGTGAEPVTSAARVGELDVLRGFALLGVLIANFVWFAAGDNTATAVQQQVFEADPVNRAVLKVVEVLVDDKANTLFAFLFGVGFWVQMERLEERGVQFARIYLRRLTVLLAFGVINILLIWPWDILNLYALAGFALFALRRMSAKAMLWLGLVLAIFGRPVMGAVCDVLGLSGPADAMAFGAEAIAARQDAYVNGSYFDWVAQTARLDYYDWLASGLIVAWFLYALGRFLIGAYVARRGWIQRAADLLPQMKRIFLIALPLGLALEIVGVLAAEAGMHGVAGKLIHLVAVPVLDLGYATGLILLFHSRRKGLALVFAPVGRMALTNYLVQGLFIGAILYGFHGGLALAGVIPPKVVLPLCVAFYALQVVFSHWWLGRYRFGPMEWLWRTLTYGKAPQFRLATAA